MPKEILDYMTELRDREESYAIAIVVETQGSVSAKTGSKAIIDRSGRLLTGWIGGGCAESAVCQEALTCMETGNNSIIDIDLDDEVLGVGMPCGGHMRVYIEPVLSRPTLWIMGHGRVAECLCELGEMVGMNVVVNDPGAEPAKYPRALKLITNDPEYKQLQPAASDYIVIATQHKGDHESMTRALNSNAAYIALIASRKRAKLVLDYLREHNFQDAALRRISAPSGLNLGAKTPEEIALSVMSEIVMRRRGGDGMRIADKPAA